MAKATSVAPTGGHHPLSVSTSGLAMKIHPSAMRLVLGVASALSLSTAVAFVPLHRQGTRRTQLAFYPSDESLAERLKNVQEEWSNVNKQGIGKFLSDELEAAGRIVRGAQSAEENAESVISQGEDDYLLKEGFHSMAETGKRLVDEIWEIRHEIDEVKAAKIVEEAAEKVVGTDVMVEKDLEKVVEGVVSSLEAAEEVVQSAIATVASKEGLTDSTRASLTEKLEDKARNIEESIKVADSVAKTAKEISIEDARIMAELEKTGDRLSQAIDATESLTEQLKGTEGGAAVDAVSSTVDQAAAIVKEDLGATESIADAVSQKVALEADAVMVMDEKAADSVKSVRAAKDSIQESNGGDANSLAEALTKDAKDIQVDATTAERLAKAIEEDSSNDQEALAALERSSGEVNDLLDTVDGAVSKAADVVEGDASAKSVEAVIEKIEDEAKEVESSIDAAKEAAEEKSSVAETVEKEDLAETKAEITVESSSAGSEPSESTSTANIDGSGGAESDGSGSADVPEAPQTTALASADHGGESLGDAIASAADPDPIPAAIEVASSPIGNGELADAVASAEAPEGLGNVVASAAGIVSDISDSISSTSEAAHDAAALAMAEVATAFSLFL